MDNVSQRSLDTAFTTFTVNGVLAVVGEFVTVPRDARRKRSVLFAYLDSFPDSTRNAIREAAARTLGTKGQRQESQQGPRKRRRTTASGQHVHTGNGVDADTETPLRHEPVHASDAMDVDSIVRLCEGPFFEPATVETQQACIARAIDRTSNAALTKQTCVVCARKLFAEDLHQTNIRDIPNKRHLIPTYPHRAHKLVNGWLLHEDAMDQGTTFVCLECHSKLLVDERPPFALSNGMWIGRIPFQLRILTLPERLLIALYFPAVYIVKLFPKVKGSRFWDQRTVNSGLKGNVSTYRLNTAHIVDIVAGTPKTMPPSPKILAATIGVTFVGHTDRPLSVLPDFFRVRRQRVFEALVWLKENNPIYADVTISQEQLLLLPVDGVPDEILVNTRISSDVAALEREHEGYVPLDVADEERWENYRPGAEYSAIGSMSGVNPIQTDEQMDDQTGPEAFPLQMHGVIDVHGEGVPDSDVYAHGFANLARDRPERSFKIRRGSAFVNEYPRLDAHGERFDGGPGNPNHMLGAFPVLFPYGKGGLEVERDVNVPYENHVRWALRYSDNRFRTDLYFMFQAFGVIQKREVCRSSGLQIKRSSFIANQVAFLNLQPKDLLQASAEETRRIPYTNPVVRKLRKHLTSLRARVPGTDESRISVRSQIWGMNLRFNPPSIWATINLADTSDPIAQVLADQEIDLDRFIATAGPNREARAINVATDPFAAAEFFHYTVKMLLEDVFGIKTSRKGKFDRKAGILGLVNGYIGTVEAQGRGTLHLHILFWLVGAPTSKMMQAALLSEAFREKILRYLKHTIRADIAGTSAEQVFTMPKKSSVAYSRPEDPRLPNYDARRREAESTIARAVQFHDCKITTCLISKGGRWVCKRRAPFPLASDDWVLPSGEWGPKRVCGRLNAWNPALLQIIRSNQDMKLITNGQETKDIAFYITLYIAKKQIQASNASALLAKSLAFHKKMNARNLTCRDVNRKMLQQCANTLSRQHEFSGPEVVGYLMGWKDRFISHNFVAIYWDEISSALRRAFPYLSSRTTLERAAETLAEVAPLRTADEVEEPTLRLQVEEGVFVLKDQLKEYTDRGDELDDMNFHDYFVDTYHGALLKGDNEDQHNESADETAAQPGPSTRRRGRPASRRVAYTTESKRKGCRVFRSAGYETVPQFVGTWFPRDDAGEYYFACMLALLKPWRSLRDLHSGVVTFEAAFRDLMTGAGDRVKTIVANVAYYHECSDGARKKQGTALAPSETIIDVNDYVRRDQDLEELNDMLVERSEDDVQLARDNRYAYREVLYGEHAMSIARDMGIFEEAALVSTGAMQGQATFDEMVKYAEWGKKVALLTRQELLKPTNAIVVPVDDTEIRIPGAYEAEVVEDVDMPVTGTRTSKQQKALDLLNIEQRRAHDIIEAHARRTLAGVAQEQLLMIVRGEGGTGKTVLLNAIADTFEYLEASTALAKTATTGVAASLVGGQTVHSWAGISVRKADSTAPTTASHATVEKRKRNILPAQYLDIDECSMLTKQLLAKLSNIVGEVRDAGGIGDATRPFGGMNVILFGDFHQFPPVADPTGALYCQRGDKPLALLGLEIYRQFTTVVTLTEQKRITDLPWKDLLGRLRHGACTEEDMVMLRGLLITDPEASIPQWDDEPWSRAVLVTPRHGVRTRWNTAALQKHCRRTDTRMYICEAEDTLGRDESELDLEQRIIVAGMTTKQTNKLAERVELAVGMRGMVMTNIATEADLANGTRGEVVDFKLDPREPANPPVDAKTGAVMLQYPPAVVFFKPDQCSFPPFEGLPPGVLPIVPSKMSFNITTSDRRKHRIHRYQLAMTPAYAFTDYKSQGQTLEFVLIDLEKPPQNKLTPFSAYVALSRSRGRDSIRLLRGFEEDIFTTHPSEELAREDECLAILTSITSARYR